MSHYPSLSNVQISKCLFKYGTIWGVKIHLQVNPTFCVLTMLNKIVVKPNFTITQGNGKLQLTHATTKHII